MTQQRIKRAILTGLLIMLPSVGFALDYRSIAVPKAVLFDAPSTQGKKLFVIGQGYPVEVIVDLGDWLKIRDNKGSLTWVESKLLGSRRTVLVTVTQAEMRQSADKAALIICRVEKDVVLDILEPAANGWVKVKHQDGLSGYVLSTAVWGL